MNFFEQVVLVQGALCFDLISCSYLLFFKNWLVMMF